MSSSATAGPDSLYGLSSQLRQHSTYLTNPILFRPFSELHSIPQPHRSAFASFAGVSTSPAHLRASLASFVVFEKNFVEECPLRGSPHALQSGTQREQPEVDERAGRFLVPLALDLSFPCFRSGDFQRGSFAARTAPRPLGLCALRTTGPVEQKPAGEHLTPITTPLQEFTAMPVFPRSKLNQLSLPRLSGLFMPGAPSATLGESLSIREQLEDRLCPSLVTVPLDFETPATGSGDNVATSFGNVELFGVHYSDSDTIDIDLKNAGYGGTVLMNANTPEDYGTGRIEIMGGLGTSINFHYGERYIMARAFPYSGRPDGIHLFSRAHSTAGPWTRLPE